MFLKGFPPLGAALYCQWKGKFVTSTPRSLLFGPKVNDPPVCLTQGDECLFTHTHTHTKGIHTFLNLLSYS